MKIQAKNPNPRTRYFSFLYNLVIDFSLDFEEAFLLRRNIFFTTFGSQFQNTEYLIFLFYYYFLSIYLLGCIRS